ncbi:MAG: hypothetical protein ABIY50_00340 [Ignavibacteria bacterium]
MGKKDYIRMDYGGKKQAPPGKQIVCCKLPYSRNLFKTLKTFWTSMMRVTVALIV